MKKLSVLFITLILSLTLAGCFDDSGSDNTTGTTGGTGSMTQAQANQTALASVNAVYAAFGAAGGKKVIDSEKIGTTFEGSGEGFTVTGNLSTDGSGNTIYNLTFTFNNYTYTHGDTTVTLNGTFHFDMTMNSSGYQIVLSTSDPLTVVSNSESYTIDYNITYNFSYAGSVFTIGGTVIVNGTTFTVSYAK